MVNPNPVGLTGERLAKQFLTRNGYTIVTSNFATRAGEIDIIALKDRILLFVEVKARVGDASTRPYEAVTYIKRRHMRMAIAYFLTNKRYAAYKYAASVISVVLTADLSLVSLKHYTDLQLT